MRTRVVLPRGVDGFVKRTQDNLPLILLGALFVAGAFCGRGMYRTISAPAADSLMLLLSGSGQQGAFHFFGAWGVVFLTNVFMVGVLFLCGFCAISQPVIVFIPFVKGLGFGLVAACNAALLTPYSSFFWLKFMPGAFLATALLLLCAKQSLALSVYVYQAVFSPQQKAPRRLPSLYCIKYLFFVVVCAAFSLVDVCFDLVYEIVTH